MPQRHASLAPLVGRTRELELLEAALESAIDGTSRLVVLDGESGIGKTRLADALASTARARGARVLWGSCWDAGGAPPFWPWLEIVRAYLREVDSATATRDLGARAGELARIVPEIREVVANAPGMTDPDDDGRRFALFEAMAGFIRAVAGARPLVLVLDDLHAADEPSLLLLRFVAAAASDARLLIVAIHRARDLDRDDPRATHLGDLARTRGATLLTPRALDAADVRDFVEESTGTSPNTELVTAIYRETEGNPLFIGEVVRLLAAEGRLDAIPLSTSGALGLPAGVYAVIAERLARLGPACHATLQRAAVIGGEFSLPLLERLEEVPREPLLAILDEAAAAHVVVKPAMPAGTWRFAHTMFRHVLYAELPSAERLALHRRIGEVLAAVHGEDDPPFAELAHHFAAAGAPEQAVSYARLAGDAAVRAYAYEEAVRLYRLAIAIAAPADPTRLELLLGLGHAATRGGDEEAGHDAFRDAARLARQLGRAEDLARAAIGYGGRFIARRAGGDQELVPLLEAALEALGGRDDTLRARLLARLAGALRDEPDLARRSAVSDEAVAVARRTGDPVILGRALLARFAAILGPDTIDELRAMLDEVHRLAVEARDPELLGDWQLNTLLLTGTTGDADELRRALRETKRLATELRQPAHSWYHDMTSSLLALAEGRLDDAESLQSETREQGDRPQRWDAEVAFRSQRFLLRREQDRLDEELAAIERSVVEFPGYRYFAAMAVYGLAATGHTADARTRLAELSRDEFRWFPRDWGWVCAMSFLAESAILLDDRERSAQLEALLAPYDRLFGTASGDGNAGPAARVLALLSAHAGRYDEALRLFDVADAMSARIGATLWRARIATERASVLATRNAAGDASEARELVGGALDVAVRLNLAAIHREAEGVLARLTPTTEPSEQGPDATSRGTVASGTFRREGEYWTIGLADLVRLRDAKGLRYLAILLADPGREFHALDLLARGDGSGPVPQSAAVRAVAREAGLTPAGDGAGGEGLDAEAKAAYRTRIRELSAEIDEAEAFNDPVRADRARDELDALERELAAAFGLGGRARPRISPAERARQSVTKAIREVLHRIAEQDANLHSHLSRSVRTGIYSIYDPDPAAAVRWEL